MSHGLDQSEMLRLLGYNIAQAAIPPYKLFESLIGLPLGLRQVEFSILTLIDTNEKVTHKRLSTALGVAAPNLTIVLDRLEQRQLVKRTRSQHDGRVQHIELTARGRALHGKAKRSPTRWRTTCSVTSAPANARCCSNCCRRWRRNDTCKSPGTGRGRRADGKNCSRPYGFLIPRCRPRFLWAWARESPIGRGAITY